MITVKEAARIWGMSERSVSGLCLASRIPGAYKEGKIWRIPDDAEKPSDNRIKTGTYIGTTSARGTLPLPIGISEYIKAESSYYYVDKTLLIRDFLDKKSQVTLFNRPRRFGKTLNMDMLRTFFEKTDEDTSKYFRNRKIWKCGTRYTAEQGIYPVIYISFKDVKSDTWDKAYEKISMLIRDEYERHAYLFSSLKSDYEIDYYARMLTLTASETEVSSSLAFLSRLLHEYHGISPVILMDEYDTPIQDAYTNGYYDESIGFIRNLFSGAFKDNRHLSYGFLTGILRIAQESIFSGLNNIDVNTVMDDEYSEYFGFTMDEVKTLASYYGMDHKFSEACEWYDGYRFGTCDIFNPWSVICYFSKNCTPRAYWVNTGSNDILDHMLENATDEIFEALTKLIQGESIPAIIDMNAVYSNLTSDSSYIYSFLLAAGYLKATDRKFISDGYSCHILIPNREVQSVYRKEILGRLIRRGQFTRSTSLEIADAIEKRDAKGLRMLLGLYLRNTISYYDSASESFYHGLILGIIALMDDRYRVLSNRESGDGRFDICMIPKKPDLPGFLMEIKHTKDESRLKELATDAMNQIKTKGYAEELKANGITDISAFGIAFCGKDLILSHELID